jgi:uncharacterized protein YecT (DUF1311 family)
LGYSFIIGGAGDKNSLKICPWSLPEEGIVLKSRFLIVTILMHMLFHSFPALADQKESAGFCDEAETVVEMQRCLIERLEKAEASMWSSLNRLMSGLTPGQKEYLSQAQKAWLVYRDRSADLVASSEEGGTLHTVEQLLVRAEMTEKRIGELEELFLRFGKNEFK